MRNAAADEGYALLAAVAAIAVFASLALAILGQVQGAVVQASAEIERAHADTAAEAGGQLAIQNLIGTDRTARWPLDGRPRRLVFAGSDLTIRLVDQRGKVPLLALEDAQVRHLFELLKVPDSRLDEVTDSYLDWTDQDDDVRPNGAESGYYARRHIHPANGPPQSFEELALVRGFDSGLVERLRAIATLHFGTGGFDRRHANTIAIAVLTDGSENTPEAIDRAREEAGQRTAIDLTEPDLPGRTVEVTVEATTRANGRSRWRQLVELTGNSDRPYVILEVE